MSGLLTLTFKNQRMRVVAGGESPPNYNSEISSMMYTFGEVRHPLSETTLLVESIVRRQISDLITQAFILAKRRGSRFMSHEDIIFLVRRNTLLVSRLNTYLSWRKVRKIANRAGTSANVAPGEDVEEDAMMDDAPQEGRPKVKKIIHVWNQFSQFEETLNAIGDSDSDLDDDDEQQEFTSDFLARLKQQDLATRAMNQAEYVDYAECRQASFTYKKPLKFREWLQIDKLAPGSNARAGSDILEVIGFICYEMVRTITERALAVKSRSEESLKQGLSAGVSGFDLERGALKQIETTLNEEYRSMGFFAGPNISAPLEPWHVEEAYRSLSQLSGSPGKLLTRKIPQL